MTDKELVERLRLHANCMMDDDCDIQGYPLNDDRCAGCPLDGHCEFVVCREKECR